MTTGPLGQGFASAIGFAYGQRFQRGLLDPEAPAGESPFDHNIWVICGEGDIEEGISGRKLPVCRKMNWIIFRVPDIWDVSVRKIFKRISITKIKVRKCRSRNRLLFLPCSKRLRARQQLR